MENRLKIMQIIVLCLIIIFSSVNHNNSNAFSASIIKHEFVKFKNPGELSKICQNGGQRGYKLVAVTYSDEHKEGIAVFVKVPMKIFIYKLLTFKKPSILLEASKKGERLGFQLTGMTYSDKFKLGIMIFVR